MMQKPIGLLSRFCAEMVRRHRTATCTPCSPTVSSCRPPVSAQLKKVRKITLAVRIGLCMLSTDTETHMQHSTQILFCGSHFTWSLAVQYSAPTRSKKTKVNNVLNLQAEAKLLWRSTLPNHSSYRIFFVMDERSGYNFMIAGLRAAVRVPFASYPPLPGTAPAGH